MRVGTNLMASKIGRDRTMSAPYAISHSNRNRSKVYGRLTRPETPTYGNPGSACRRPRRLPVFSRVSVAGAGPATSRSEREAGRILHRPEDGISLGIDAAEQRNPPLGPFKQLVGLSQQSDAFLVTSQGLVQTDFPLFQQVNNLLQPAERLFETRRVGLVVLGGLSEILPLGGVAIMVAPVSVIFYRALPLEQTGDLNRQCTSAAESHCIHCGSTISLISDTRLFRSVIRCSMNFSTEFERNHLT